jgi:hypothetical protein
MMAAVVILLAGGLAAQSVRLSGTVRNDKGAVLPGVTVSVSGPALGKALTTTTNARGTYSFGNLLAADGYVVTFSLVCFRTETQQKVSVPTDKDAGVDAVLRLGTCEPETVRAFSGRIVPLSTE